MNGSAVMQSFFRMMIVYNYTITHRNRGRGLSRYTVSSTQRFTVRLQVYVGKIPYMFGTQHSIAL